MQESQGSENSPPEKGSDWQPLPGGDGAPGDESLRPGQDSSPAGQAAAGEPAVEAPAAGEPAPHWQARPPGENPRGAGPPATNLPADGIPPGSAPHGSAPHGSAPHGSAPSGNLPARGVPYGGAPTSGAYGGPGYGQAAGQAQPGAPGAWILPPGGQGNWAGPPGGQGLWQTPPGGGYGQPAGGQPPRGPAGAGRILVYILVAILAAALGAGGVLALQGRSSSNAGGPAGDSGQSGTGSGNGSTNTSSINVHAVAAKVEPGVVDITSFLRYQGQVFEGTGIVLSPSGLVLTNNHVVNGSTRLQATLVTTGHKYAAQIVGTDAKDDVALIRLVGASGLKPVKLGDSSKVTVGTPVVALGNAGGTGGRPTVTSGSITALDRTITASDAGAATSETLHGMLQTNAPIAEGDSGGPLANAAGQVIGMDTAANTRNLGGFGTNQGFAIPINPALAIAHQMAQGHGSGSIRIGQPAFLGIAIASTTRNSASTAASPQQQLRQLEQVATASGGGVNSSGSRCLTGNIGNPVPSGGIAPVRSGTLIAGVFCNAPAHNAGMRGGDVIVSVNSHPVSSPASLTSTMLANFHPGNIVKVTWVDTSGQRHTSSLKLAAGPAK